MLDITGKFLGIKIAVIGDVMLDKYVSGKVERISPEADVPILTVTKERCVPGGAANAASNVAALGGLPYLLGVVGVDTAQTILENECRKREIDVFGLAHDKSRKTTEKIRIVGPHQQLLRLDYEEREEIEKETTVKLISSLNGLEGLSAIAVSDYAKGVVTRSLMNAVMDYAHNHKIPVIVDPKPRHKDFYRGAFLITPNSKEAQEMAHRKFESEEDVVYAGNQLSDRLDSHVLITRGEEGMTLFEKGNEPLTISAIKKEVSDVSGAGDTVIAALALAITSGASLPDAARIANYAAGIKVGKHGTATVSINELESILRENKE